MKELSLPQTLEAKTKDELIVLCQRAQIKFSRKIHFYDFSFAKSKWHCWFDLPVTAIRENNG